MQNYNSKFKTYNI